MTRPELPYSACWTLADHVDRAASLWPDAEAVVSGETRATFEGFADATFEVARALLALGVEPGETVGVLLPAGLPALTALYGVTRTGAVAVPLDPGLTDGELQALAHHADLAVLIASDATLELPDTPTLRRVVALDDTLATLAAGVPGAEVRTRQRRIRVTDTALLLYAAPGTTDAPRGARLGHEALVRSARVFGELRFPMQPGERLFDPLPLSGLGALQPFNACLAVGAAFVGLPPAPAFDPAAALDVLARERCTHAVPAVDTLWAAILDQPGAPDTLEHLWLVAVDGDPALLTETAAHLPEAVQVAVYGANEIGGLIALSHLDDPLETRIASAGRPFHGIEVRILDPGSGDRLTAGHVGQIAVRGWSLFQGHHKDGLHLDADGFLRTGDAGALDEAGRLLLATG
jgi:fatty-acyl-CoA synthase